VQLRYQWKRTCWPLPVISRKTKISQGKVRDYLMNEAQAL
jgi:hypothetical protein